MTLNLTCNIHLAFANHVTVQLRHAFADFQVSYPLPCGAPRAVLPSSQLAQT